MAEPGRAERRGWLVPPGIAVLRGYRRTWLRGDLLAGVTVAAYLIPQVMAYAQVAVLPVAVGLWAVLPALVAYALLGSSSSLSMGPESTTALMTAVAIGPLAAGHSARYAQLATSLALLVGVFSLAAGLLRLGFVADLLSRPVLVGCLAGVGLTMIAGQLSRVTGVPVAGRTFAAEVGSFATHLGTAAPPTLVLAAAVLVFLFLVAWRWPQLPGPLLAILLATVVVAAAGLAVHGVSVVGPIPAGLPAPQLPDIHPADVQKLLLPAFSVLVVGFSDDVLTARSFAKPAERCAPNRNCSRSARRTSAPACCTVSRSAAARAAPLSRWPPAAAARCTRWPPRGRYWWRCFSSGRCWPGFLRRRSAQSSSTPPSGSSTWLLSGGCSRSVAANW